MKKKIHIYDTTLRDGTQSKDIDFNRSRKIEILRLMDTVGIDYAELGWPGSNEEDMQVFLDAAKMHLRYTQIAAFGSTRRMKLKAEDDANLVAILNSKAPVATIYGKTDVDHVQYQLQATPEENTRAIYDSVRFLKENGLKIFYDAEHYFDGFKKSKEYALETLSAACDAGADCLVLCDTNGGCLPWEIEQIIKISMAHLEDKVVEWGIHTHNDAGFATANSIVAVKNGITHVQGTINGYGERAGNANLCEIIPNIMLKMGGTTSFDLKKLTKISRDLDRLARILANPNAPYVGENAFAHKGGIHVDAIRKFEERAKGKSAYEHVDPQLVGNKRQFVLSELSGKSNIIAAAKFFQFDVEPDDPGIFDVLNEVEDLRKKGYNIGGLKAEIYLLLEKHFGYHKQYFEITSWSVETRQLEWLRSSTAVITAKVNGKEDEASCTGVTIHNGTSSNKNKRDHGPVSAVYKALTKLLMKAYPHIFQEDQNVKLISYNSKLVLHKGEDSAVRVKIRFNYSKQISSGKKIKYEEYQWETVGVSSNIIEASVEAISKAFNYIIRITKKSLTDVLNEDDFEPDFSSLRGENFDFDPAGIELLHRISNNYRRKLKSRSRKIEAETFLVYLDQIFRKKADKLVKNNVIACLKKYSDDPTFLAPEQKPDPHIIDFFETHLNTLYLQTKIGKYNRQFEHIAKCIGSLSKNLSNQIDKLGLDIGETKRVKGHLVGTIDAMAEMFDKYWITNGSSFYKRIQYWKNK